ncbi:hypothetical protein V6N11_010037 [Hibiscus sabdariffa]|uniref:Retrotransposon gag protein n=1 Tax=Hibiscus sabdariffa TaxID=183260 RepID=A0ABR2PDG0_9ROSI
MTRRNPTELVDFEPEIEARARRTHGQTLQEKKKKQREQADSEGTTSTTTEESTDSSRHPAETTSTPNTEVTHAPMANQTIRELAAAPAVEQPLCITFLQGETPFQLKTGLIHLLHTFHGLPSKSPHKNLTEFHLRTDSCAMAANSQQFGVISEPNRRVHEVNTVSIERKLDQLTNIVSSLVAGKSHSFKACGICTMTDHLTDSCPNLYEENVNAIGNFPGPPQRPYNPYSNTYNPGWRDHPNLSYAPKQRSNLTYQPRPSQQYQPSNKPSLETLMEESVQSQTRTDSQVQEIEKQVSLLAKTVGRLESQGKLPSQTEPNPKENVLCRE